MGAEGISVRKLCEILSGDGHSVDPFGPLHKDEHLYTKFMYEIKSADSKRRFASVSRFVRRISPHGHGIATGCAPTLIFADSTRPTDRIRLRVSPHAGAATRPVSRLSAAIESMLHCTAASAKSSARSTRNYGTRARICSGSSGVPAKTKPSERTHACASTRQSVLVGFLLGGLPLCLFVLQPR
jgi:hypothetical protein